MATKVIMRIQDDGIYSFLRCWLPHTFCKEELLAEGIELLPREQVSSEELLHGDVQIFHGLWSPQVMPKIRDWAKHKRLVWFMDDDLFNLSQSNPLYSTFGYTEKETMRECLELSHCIVCTTEILRQALGYLDKTVVCPNLMDMGQFREYCPRPEFKRVGYAAGFSHWADARLIEPVVKNTDKQFIFFGTLPEGITEYNRVPGSLSLTFKPQARFGKRVGFVGVVPFWNFYSTLIGCQFDVGLCPLVDNHFNSCKSNLKWLEYSCLGIPTIASNVEPYRSCIDHGRTGFLVNNTEEWIAALEKCNNDVGYAAYCEVRDKWSWTSPAKELWMNAFRRMVQ